MEPGRGRGRGCGGCLRGLAPSRTSARRAVRGKASCSPWRSATSTSCAGRCTSRCRSNAWAAQHVFAPVKNKKTRDVPVAARVIPVLSEHVRRFPPVSVTLPWHDPRDPRKHGQPVTRELVFTRPTGVRHLEREAFNRPWRAAWKAAGVPDRGPRLNGCHVLRHTAASAWLSAGLTPPRSPRSWATRWKSRSRPTAISCPTTTAAPGRSWTPFSTPAQPQVPQMCPGRRADSG